MGSTGDDGGFSLMELFVVKFVLADVIIIAALVFAGPLYALAITALLVLSVVLVWYLSERVGSSTDGSAVDEADRTMAAIEEVDPVTTLQERYASGDLSEAEFEHRLDRLLDADERAADADVETKQLSLERE